MGRWYLVATLVAITATLALRLLSWFVGEGGGLLRQLSDLLAVFAVAVPSVTSALTGLRLPQALGARGLAFPRLFLLGFWLHLGGVLLAVGAATIHAPNTVHVGWLLYSAYDPTTTGPAEWGLLVGVALIAAGLVLTSICVVTSVHALRHPDLTWQRLPLGVIGLYAHAVAVLLAAPFFVAAVVLAGAERALGLGLLQGAGADPVFFLHLYWRGMHPLLMVGLASVLGLALEVLASSTQGVGRPGQRRALLLFAILACTGYGQHLIGQGISPLVAVLFSFYALMALAPLIYLLESAIDRPADWPRDEVRPLLVALTVVALSVGFLGLALGSGALSTNLGADMVLFGHRGRDLLVGLVALGFVQFATHRAAQLR